MNIAFRTDASLQIGSGHVMRCLTLADALQAAGGQCHFICREHPGHLIAQIRQRGFSVTVLPMMPTEALSANKQGSEAQSNYAAWLGADWATDAAQTKADIGELAADWLIIDHYALDTRWEQTLRPECRKLMVIDDLANRLHDCDLLLDQNLGRDAQDYSQLVSEQCRVLVGPHYALLRPEFAALRDESLRRRAKPQLKQLLITMGGVDQDDATGKVLEALQSCLPIDLRITVVMGTHAPWLERVEMLAKQMPQVAEVKVAVNNMAQLMADSDLAIGAAGSTSWERCCLGLPTILVVLAANQRDGAAALEQHGSVGLIGNVDDISCALPSMLSAFVSADALHQLSQTSCSITDGDGASRILTVLSECYG